MDELTPVKHHHLSDLFAKVQTLLGSREALCPLLLTGINDTRLLDFAKSVSHYALCLTPTKQGACGACKACHLLAHDTHPDFALLQPNAGQALLIDEIRALALFAKRHALIGQRQVCVIASANHLTPSAQQCLLKTLEEPHANTLFLLLTEIPSALLATIRSRCFSLKLPPQELAKKALGFPGTWPKEQADEINTLFLGLLKGENNLFQITEKLSPHSLSEQLYYLIGVVSNLIAEPYLYEVALENGYNNQVVEESDETKLSSQRSNKLFKYLDKLTAILADQAAGVALNPALTLEGLLIDWQEI